MARPDFICPICWRTFAASEIPPEWPCCPDCESEAISVDVARFDEFVCSTTEDELQEAIRSWQDASNLRDEFRRTVIARIRAVLKLKRG